MCDKRKIIVIENQQFQFDRIIKNLNGYNIFPTDDEFILFIDHIRVWINKQYNSDYRDKAWKYIENCICSKKIELIVMDHILGGAHHCQTGIDLAVELNSKRIENDKSIIPVLFLSKTEDNEESRFKKYEKYEGEFPGTSLWVHKGFFGDEILNSDYIEKRVIPPIEKLLGNSEEQIFFENLKVIQSLSFAEAQDPIKKAIDKIAGKEYQDLSNELKNMINEVAKSGTVGDLKLEILES